MISKENMLVQFNENLCVSTVDFHIYGKNVSFWQSKVQKIVKYFSNKLIKAYKIGHMILNIVYLHFPIYS